MIPHVCCGAASNRVAFANNMAPRWIMDMQYHMLIAIFAMTISLEFLCGRWTHLSGQDILGLRVCVTAPYFQVVSWRTRPYHLCVIVEYAASVFILDTDTIETRTKCKARLCFNMDTF
mmetsp:Transcript_11571/g.24673  ORF Transcript_11571/g.24673 Transcript_11571/m.24673 type:complete len:118 (+) Transcript_11571:231-584(+)